MKIFTICILLLLCSFTYGQNQRADLLKLKEFTFPEKHNDRVVKFGISDSESKIAKYNPISLGLGGLMFMYQKFISPQFSAGCLYEPGCSDFSKALLKQYGVIKGTCCSADRLMRCNRLSATDFRKTMPKKKHNRVSESLKYYQISKKQQKTIK